MTTVHAEAIQDAVNDRLSGKDAVTWAKVLSECLNDFNSGEYPQSYVDMIFQKFDRFKPNIYDAYCFLQVHTAIRTGKVAVTCVEMDSEPVSDRDIAGNNSIIGRIPKPFFGKFTGGNYDADGHIGWDTPIHASIAYDGKLFGCVLPPMSLPLEVGTVDSSKMHLYTSFIGWSGGVCRFPYYQNRIYILSKFFLRGTEDDFQDQLSKVGETIDEYMPNDTRNPFIKWNAHQSKRKPAVKHSARPKANPIELPQQQKLW